MKMKVSIAALLVVTATLAATAHADVAFNASTTPAPPHRHLSSQAASCSLQDGVDFLGNDIASVSNVAVAGDCCAKCNAMQGCGAFTWTNWNGGTCWLKSSKGGTVPLAGAQSAEVAASSASPGRCSIESGVDYKANDIANVRAAAASDCCAVCSARQGCGAFTWTAYNGGTCWLKSGKGETVATPGAFSAVVGTLSNGAAPATTSPTPSPPVAGVCLSAEKDTDYIGEDIANVPGSGADDCCAKCTAYNGCKAFTWTNWNGGTCWLKSAKGTATPLPGAVSARVSSGGASSTPAPYATSTGAGECQAVQENIDYPGNDIANVQGTSASDCCAKCRQRAGCVVFTWTTFNGGTCWLKSAKGTATPLPGAVSAAVPGAASPASPSVTPTSTTATPTTTPATSSPVATSHIQPRLRAGEIPLRSVNLGGWLVGENWMSLNSPAWKDAGEDAAPFGEYITMQKLGKDKGTQQFEQHRATWITEADIQQIAAAGMNAVRVPVGFWIVNDDPSTTSTEISRVYAAGGLKYLDKLINEWAVTYNLAVMLSLHAHQGSQNGYDHSAPQVFGAVTWSNSQANVDNSLQFATVLAARYKNSIAFLGMNLMNEPMFPTDINVVQAYYKEAYTRIRATQNDCILVTSPLLWEQAPPVMMNFMHSPEYKNVWHEFHTYFRWTHEGKTEQQILDTARPYRQVNIDPWTGNPLHLGEWSLAGPDSAPFQDKEMLRQYATIQMTNYAAAKAGWSFWSWRHDEETTKISGWSLRQLIKEGIITIPRVN